MIDGVEIKSLVRHHDERGYFEEIIRRTDDFFSAGFGQLSCSHVHHGIIKAWHAHKIQTQWTAILSGAARVALHDARKDSRTYRETMELLVGDNYNPVIYKFPPGVLHGYKCISGPMLVIYVTSGIYDLSDEVRIPYDDSSIGYDWLAGPAIK